MDLCHIWVGMIDPFNKRVELVFNIWNLFDLSDLFN